MKNKVIIIILLLGVFSIGFAQNNIKRPDSYNYNRGVEAIQNNKTEEAIEYLNKELEQNPENGYALAWLATVRNDLEEYGRAITAINLAIKHLPKKDKVYKAFAYTIRASVYINLDDNVAALKDYTTAIEYTPDDEDIYEKRAQLYYVMKEYNLADEDYKKIISLNQGSVMGYMGIGRNANAQNKFEDAIIQFDYVTKLT